MNDAGFAEDFKAIMLELGIGRVDEEGVKLFRAWYGIYHLFWLVKRFFIIFSYIAIFLIVLKTDIIQDASNPFKIAFLSGIFFVYVHVFSIMPYLERQTLVSLAIRLIKMYPEHYILKEDPDGGDS